MIVSHECKFMIQDEFDGIRKCGGDLLPIRIDFHRNGDIYIDPLPGFYFYQCGRCGVTTIEPK